jgi:UDP-N-acetylmuramyl tripeptide synthase
MPARIPLAVVTGSNGKTTTTRLSAHILHRGGACVGLTCTDGVYVDGERIHAGDLSGGRAAQELLIDPRIDAAVLEVARGAILKSGRLNFVSGLPFGVILDYCHNRHGLAAVGPVVDRLPVGGRRILVYSMPGNRRAVDFEQAMQVAAQHFDLFHLYPLKERYLRGRARSEMTGLLAHGLRAASVAGRRILEYASQEEALGQVLAMAQPGDLVFVATLSSEAAYEQIKAFAGARGAGIADRTIRA